MKDKIIVVTHKDYHFPKENMYMPICVGTGISELKNTYQADNTGVNISSKNISYCELSAIFWAWKNLDISKCDYIGVNHYRRYFSIEKNQTLVEYAISQREFDTLKKNNLKGSIYVTPKRWYLTSIKEHYIKSLAGYEKIHEKDIQRLIAAIHTLAPEYDKVAEKVLNGHSAHMLNMFLMPVADFISYCNWLFPIVEYIEMLSEDRKDIRRYLGALSEFMLDMWLLYNNKNVVELQLLETEKVSLLTRIRNYVKRKI